MSDALDRLAAHPLPFATLMGVTFTAASADEVVATLAVREDLCTAGSIVHGGALMAWPTRWGRPRPS